MRKKPRAGFRTLKPYLLFHYHVDVTYHVCFFSEYNPIEAPKLNEKVLKDKRKKLKETFDRVMNMYVSTFF